MAKGQFLVFCLLLPALSFAEIDRDIAIEEALSTLEAKMEFLQPNSKQITTEVAENKFSPEVEEDIPKFIFSSDKDIYLILGMQLGYLKGNTAYDFGHHTSELKFPMDNVMGGGKLNFGYKDLSFMLELWTPIEDYAGFEMEDKDWTNGVLVSYTKSKAYLDAIIYDASLRYDFYKKEDLILWDKEDLSSGLKFDQIKIGILLGYRYERFDYDMYDLRYPYPYYVETTTHQGTRVLTYKIKYHLPYLGLAADLLRENFGFGMNIRYSFYPTAEDVDNHLLRGLTFYADYDKNGEAFLTSIYGFWEFMKNWKLKLGADGTFIRIDGITWEENRSPAWDKDQSTDTKHWIFWSGIEYRF